MARRIAALAAATGSTESGNPDVRGDDLLVGCAGKPGFPGPRLSRQGDMRVVRVRRRLPEGGMRLAGWKDGGSVYPGQEPGV